MEFGRRAFERRSRDVSCGDAVRRNTGFPSEGGMQSG
jgi:hypothetical protein